MERRDNVASSVESPDYLIDTLEVKSKHFGNHQLQEINNIFPSLITMVVLSRYLSLTPNEH